MIVGVGTDITEIVRIKKVMQKDQERFLRRIFIDSEYEIAKDKNFSFEHIAGRWACKESVAKALGTGIGEECGFHDIEIYYTEKGAPEVRLMGAAAQTARHRDIFRVKVSISHEKNYAIAFAVAVS